MRITPRSHEIQKIIELLEDPTFDSAEAMAKAVIKEVGDMLQMRDLFVLVHTWHNGGKGLNYGPFGSVAEGEAWAKKVAIGGHGRIVPLTASGITLANVEGRPDGWPGYCYDPQCGHPPYTHSSSGTARGKCQLTTCKCDRFVKDDPNKKKTKKKAASSAAATAINEL
ncbi:hypothetical protein [Streptomyces sp. NPDC002547]